MLSEQTIAAALTSLIQKAIENAGTYVQHAKRNVITSKDIVLCLQYEAHEFFQRPSLEHDLQEIINSIHSESDSESESESETNSESEMELETETETETGENGNSANTDPEDEFTYSQCKCDLCEQIHTYHHNWDSFNPTDPIVSSIKNAVNSISV